MSTSSPSSASSMSLSPSLDSSSCVNGSLSKLGGDWTTSAVLLEGGGGGGAFFNIGLGAVVSTGAATACGGGGGCDSVLGGGEDALEDAFEKFPGVTSIFCFSNC